MPNFSHSCRNIEYNPNDARLTADCKADDGEYEFDDMLLDRHIGNIDGQLRFNSDSFLATSQDCHLEFGDNNIPVWLVCTCQKIDQSWVPSQLLLDSGISNINGSLEID